MARQVNFVRSTKNQSLMRYRQFPGTNIQASEIGFGTWTLSTGWWGEKTDDEAVEMLRVAHTKYGINFYDTADTYGNGHSNSSKSSVRGSTRTMGVNCSSCTRLESTVDIRSRM